MGIARVLRAASPSVKIMSSKSANTVKEVACILPVIAFDQYRHHNFDEIIDVRTPLEYEEDHVKGSINLPVLSNEERVEVGTLYSKDKLSARKIGAALIYNNLSNHIREHFKDKELDYKPLVYCWRGGQRSKSMATLLKEIGFQPVLLQGGYKAYRKHIGQYLCGEDGPGPKETLLEKLKFIRISGLTGSGKTLILQALQARGEQVLDLEFLAKHKGSILGDYPDGVPQPSQKWFETELFNTIESFEPSRVVWLENEGSKIGRVGVSRRVWEKMKISPRVHIKASQEDRTNYILKDYHYFLCPGSNMPSLLKQLEKYAGQKTYLKWIKLFEEGEFRELTTSLMEYYDASYRVPSGVPIREMIMPDGLLLNADAMIGSDYISDFIQLGNQHIAQALQNGSGDDHKETKDSGDNHNRTVEESPHSHQKEPKSVEHHQTTLNRPKEYVSNVTV